MGKGSRSREQRTNQTEETNVATEKLSKLQLIKRQEKKKKTKKIVSIVILAVLVAAVIAGVAIAVAKRAPALDKTVAASSEYYEIDDSMMAFFLYSSYNQFVSNNSSYLTYYGLDTTKSLKSQYISDTMTWHEYFMNQAKSNVEQLVVLASQAKKEGLELDDDDKKDIDDAIASYSTYATNYGYSSVDQYVSKLYCSGVNLNTVRRCFELQQLASKYYDKYMDSLDYTDEDFEKYATDNYKLVGLADYIAYAFTAEKQSGETTASDSAFEAAKKLADELAGKAKTPDEFIAAIKVLVDKANEDTKDYNFDDKKSSYVITDGKYSDNDTLNWVFDSSRTENEVNVIKTDTGYTVVMVTKPVHRNLTQLVNVRHILVSEDKFETDDAAKAKADELLAEINAAEDKETLIKKLVSQYSEDTGSVSNGGLYENVAPGDMVTEFDDWCFEEGRQPGDTGVVKTKYGYHVMYFVGNGMLQWQSTAKSNLTSADYNAHYETLKAAFPITYNGSNLNYIP